MAALIERGRIWLAVVSGAFVGVEDVRIEGSRLNLEVGSGRPGDLLRIWTQRVGDAVAERVLATRAPLEVRVFADLQAATYRASNIGLHNGRVAELRFRIEEPTMVEPGRLRCAGCGGGLVYDVSWELLVCGECGAMFGAESLEELWVEGPT